ncbi:MAG: PAS domain-containing sensor histidine kinase [Chloroflexi bacterium]|nr:PAS domain-containing sensor histidine kinase [Chloroflexota bacterium]
MGAEKAHRKQVEKPLHELSESPSARPGRERDASAEADMVRSAQYMRLLLESTDEGVFGLDPQGLCTYVNASGARILGYDPSALVGKRIHEIIHHTRNDGSPYPESDCPSHRAYQTGQGLRTEDELFWRRDGSSFPVEYASHPIFMGGNIVGAVVSFVDITERKQAEAERARLLAEVRRVAAELNVTLTSIADALVIYDPTGEIVRMNPAAEDMLGYTPAERKLPFAERTALLHIDTPEGKPFPVEQVPGQQALNGETVYGVVMVLHPNGKTFWVSGSAAPIRSPDGQIVGAVSIFTDITALHELQEQREDLARTVSHDLRNPLQIILGRAQIIQRVPGNEKMVLTSAEAIVTSAKRMNAMIQDLVDSVRLETRQLQPQKQPIDLRSFVQELLGRGRGMVEVERIKVRMPAHLPPVSADPDRLERILMNLLSNALKYSPPDSEVLIGVEATDRWARISVADRGVGIAPQDLPHIFERFYRAKGVRKAEGLGLGLYIARMLVEAQGGRIWAESEPGKGSTFYFTLPVA